MKLIVKQGVGYRSGATKTFTAFVGDTFCEEFEEEIHNLVPYYGELDGKHSEVEENAVSLIIDVVPSNYEEMAKWLSQEPYEESYCLFDCITDNIDTSNYDVESMIETDISMHSFYKTEKRIVLLVDGEMKASITE